MTQQPLCITYDTPGNGDVSLKSGFIHHLPHFEGTSGENPNQFLTEFHIVCSTMKQGNATLEKLMLRAFPFALRGPAKDWLHYLPAGTIDSWNTMKKVFLEKYFSADRANHLKKQISNILQDDGESLYEFWERFKKTCTMCPYHGFPEHDLILFFIGGLRKENSMMLTSACGGNIQNKTIAEAHAIIEDLSGSSRQFRTKSRTVKSIGSDIAPSNVELANDLREVKQLMKEFMQGKGKTQLC